ncbi:MAG: GNAT family N-acetyltransferase [Bradymonadaceae bacterium]|nr:GNAT family N-acetyltransferase [Lujinxingiaceae bacterium]
MATWQSPNQLDDQPILFRARDYHELTGFLRQDIPLNLFQLCWLEKNGVEANQPNAFHFRGRRDGAGELQAAALVITNRLLLLDARGGEHAAFLGAWYGRNGAHLLHHIVSAKSSVEPFWQAYRTGNALAGARLIQDQELYYLTPDLLEEALAVESQPGPSPSAIRTALSQDLDGLFLASVRMHREETLEDPLERDPELFRRHVQHRVDSGRSFVWTDSHRRLLFKADISAQGNDGLQISGVFTAPMLRGQGYASRAMFDLCQILFDQGAPLITLYVNHTNTAAKRVYTRVGFRYYADYQTVFVAV